MCASITLSCKTCVCWGGVRDKSFSPFSTLKEPNLPSFPRTLFPPRSCSAPFLPTCLQPLSGLTIRLAEPCVGTLIRSNSRSMWGFDRKRRRNRFFCFQCLCCLFTVLLQLLVSNWLSSSPPFQNRSINTPLLFSSFFLVSLFLSFCPFPAISWHPSLSPPQQDK